MGIRDQNKRFYLECDCGCGILEFERWYWEEGNEDNSLSFTYYVRSFDASWFTSFRRRIKQAWKLLIGDDSFVWNVCVEEKDLTKFKEFVNSI